MTQDYTVLVDRIAGLEAKVAELASYLRSAMQYLSSDPHSSLTKSRVTLEKLLISLYRRLMKREPTRPMIGDMLSDKQFTAAFPRRILARINAIRDMSNLGPHGEDVESSDAARVMGDLVDVLDWYVLNHQRQSPCDSAADSTGASMELLSQLKSLYGQYLRPEITAVRFCQDGERCYLEITSAETLGGYLRNQTIKRDDLGFVAGGVGERLFFEPTAPVATNSLRFITEFDEVSIINCTDLFTDEAAAMIDEQWRKSQPPPRRRR